MRPTLYRHDAPREHHGGSPRRGVGKRRAGSKPRICCGAGTGLWGALPPRAPRGFLEGPKGARGAEGKEKSDYKMANRPACYGGDWDSNGCRNSRSCGNCPDNWHYNCSAQVRRGMEGGIKKEP